MGAQPCPALASLGSGLCPHGLQWPRGCARVWDVPGCGMCLGVGCAVYEAECGVTEGNEGVHSRKRVPGTQPRPSWQRGSPVPCRNHRIFQLGRDPRGSLHPKLCHCPCASASLPSPVTGHVQPLLLKEFSAIFACIMSCRALNNFQGSAACWQLRAEPAVPQECHRSATGVPQECHTWPWMGQPRIPTQSCSTPYLAGVWGL